MRIAVNTRFLLPRGLEGLGRYTHHLMQELVRQRPDDEFVFFFDRAYDERYVYGPNVTPVVLRPPARHPLLWWWWFERALPAALRRHRIDVLFSPDNFCSLRSEVPTVMTFHDLGYLHFPQQVKRSARWYYQRYFPRYAVRAERLIAISEAVKQDLLRHYPIEDQKMVVAHHAAAGRFAPVDEPTKRRMRERYTQGHPYFLFVGAIQPRKNVANLIRAFTAFKRNTGRSERLVLAGRMAWHTADVRAELARSPFRSHIVLPGFVDEQTLPRLVGSALVFVLPSYLEGFGLPVLEAQEAGVPVLTTNVSALPEVAGRGALYFPPDDVVLLATLLERLCTDSRTRTQLIERGHRNGQRFSWAASARIVGAEIDAVADQPRLDRMG